MLICRDRLKESSQSMFYKVMFEYPKFRKLGLSTNDFFKQA